MASALFPDGAWHHLRKCSRRAASTSAQAVHAKRPGGFGQPAGFVTQRIKRADIGVKIGRMPLEDQFNGWFAGNPAFQRGGAGFTGNLRVTFQYQFCDVARGINPQSRAESGGQSLRPSAVKSRVLVRMRPEQQFKLVRGQKLLKKFQAAPPAPMVDFHQLPRVLFLVFLLPPEDLQEFFAFDSRQVLEFREDKIRAAQYAGFDRGGCPAKTAATTVESKNQIAARHDMDLRAVVEPASRSASRCASFQVKKWSMFALL